VTVEQPPVPLRTVIVRRVLGKSPAVAVAVAGDADTVFIFERKVPVAEAAAGSSQRGLIRVSLLGLALILLACGALATWRFVNRNAKPSQ
jgi:hypothetical protein